MTTTLPFTPSSTNKVLSISNTLVFPELSGTRTWFSADATNWTSSAWIDWTDVSGRPLAFGIWFGGEMLYFETSLESTYLFNFSKTTDFLHWTNMGEFKVQFDNLGFDDPFSNFFYNMKMVVHGGAIRAFRMASGTTFVHRYSTTDGISWTDVETNLPYSSYISRIVSFAGYLFAIPSGNASYKSVYRSGDGGVTWECITTDWGVTSTTLVDCVATSSGLMAVFYDNETWVSADGITWTKKSYTLPTGTGALYNGVIRPISSNLLMVGCGTTKKNVFKLIDSSAPSGIPL